MWKAIVEKLLTRFLSQYVDGIEREKLQVELLSGDIELTDLTVKPETADALDLPFSIVFGRIGKLSIGISWTKWMAQNYDLRVSVEHVHLLLKPRELHHEKTAADIREELREAKKRQIEHQEKAFIELLKEKESTSQSHDNAGFLMKVTNKLLRNVQVDLKDVHIAFHDSTRCFTIGTLLDSGSFFSCDDQWHRAPETRIDVDKISKAIELRGLSIYGGTAALSGWNQIAGMAGKQEAKIAAQQVIFNIQGGLELKCGIESGVNRDNQLSPDRREIKWQTPSSMQMSNPPSTTSNDESAPLLVTAQSFPVLGPSAVLGSQQPKVNSILHHRLGIAGHLSGKYSSDKERSSSHLNYILLPLQLLFRLTCDTKAKNVAAKLEIGSDSKGITLDRNHLRTILLLYHEAAINRRRCQKILMSRSHLVRLDAEALNTTTKNQFMHLYWKKLQNDLKLPGNAGPLSASDTERLQLLHDVVSVRHVSHRQIASCTHVICMQLARWRANCASNAEKIDRASHTKVQAQVLQARREQSWWDWATKGGTAVEEAVLHQIEEQGGAETLLTEEELHFMSDAVRTEANAESVDTTPATFKLSFSLPRFAFILNEEQPGILPFLNVDFSDVGAELTLSSLIDKSDKEIYVWLCRFKMSDFSVSHRGRSVIFFDKENASQNLQPVSPHFRSNEVDDWRQATSRPSSMVQSSQKKSASLEQPLQNSLPSVTIWEFERSVIPEGNVLSAFLRMSALEIIFKPELLKDSLSFFVFATDEGAAFADTESEPGEEAGKEEFYEGVYENAQRLRAAANEKSPDLLKLDVELCAPILYWYTPDEGCIQLYLGQLSLHTMGSACRYNNIVCNVEMDQTQLSCISKSGKTVPVLRPIPIRIQFHYLPSSNTINFDVLFIELYIEVNPEALLVLLAIPSSITKSLVSSTVRPQGSTTTTRSISNNKDALKGDVTDIHKDALQPMSLSPASDAAVEEVQWPTEYDEEEGTDLKELKGPILTIVGNVLISRMGFSLYNMQSKEVLRVVAIDLSSEVSLTPQNDASDEQVQHTTELTIELGRMFVSDPSTKTPLFLTLGMDGSRAGDNELFGPFGPVVQGVARRPSRRPSHLYELFGGMRSESTAVVSVPEVDKSLKATKLLDSINAVEGEDMDDFKDAVDTRQVTFQVRYSDSPIAIVSVTATPCEIHWQKHSIKEVMETIQDLKLLAKSALERQIDSLRHNYLSASSHGNEVSLTEEAFGSIAQTLLYVKNRLSSHYEVADESSETPSSRNETTSPEFPSNFNDQGVVGFGLQHDAELPAFTASAVEPSFKFSVFLRGAGVRFWQEGMPFGRAEIKNFSANLVSYGSKESELELELGAVEVEFDGRFILSTAYNTVGDPPLDPLSQHPGDISEMQRKESSKVFSSKIRFYNSDELQYSACMSGVLSKITYMYLQKDLNRILTYLSDGILDVLLWNTYEAARQLANTSVFLFAVNINDPVFILPEDKATIPQLQDKQVACQSGYQGDYFHNITTLGTSDNRKLNGVTIEGLGSYIALNLGRLIIKNAYTRRPVAKIDTLDEKFVVETETKKDSNYMKPVEYLPAATIYLMLEGLSASMHYSPYYGSFSEKVTGSTLAPVSLHAKLRCGDPFLVDMNISDFCLKLSREQLTLLLDILNENFGGLGYHPTAIELQQQQTDSQGIIDSTKLLEEEAVEKSVNEILATPPLRISVRILVDVIELDVSFGPEKPLGNLQFPKIFISCDVCMYAFYLTYHFALLGESVVFNDNRLGTNNAYKRFLECLPPINAMNCQIVPPNISHLNYHSAPPYQDDAVFPGVHLHWLRPGIEIRRLDTNLTGPDNHLASGQKNEIPENPAFFNSISIGLDSCLVKTSFYLELTNPVVSVLTVGLQDLLDFVMSGFGFSTMRRFPKPAPPVMTAGANSLSIGAQIEARMSQIIPQTKPFLIDVDVHNGTFHIFSRPAVPTEPILKLQTNLIFRAESIDNCLAFKQFDIFDCEMRRVDTRPVDQMETPSGSQPSPRPSFEVLSSVIICEKFSVKARGCIETDPELYFKTPDSKSLDHSPAAEPPLISPDKSFSMKFEPDPPHLSDYRGRKDVSLSHISMEFDIADFAMRVSSRDFAVLISAFRSLQSDFPAASPGLPSPPIIPSKTEDLLSPTITEAIEDETDNTALSQKNAFSFLGGESLANDDNRTMTVNRFYRFGFRIGEIDAVVLDDLRSTISPILKLVMSLDHVSIHMTPHLFHIAIGGLNAAVDYLSPKIGEWEPFVEKFNITAHWRYLYQHEQKWETFSNNDVATTTLQQQQQQDVNVGPKSSSRSTLPKYPLLPGQSHLSPQNILGSPQESFAAAARRRTRKTITGGQRSASDWTNFHPDSQITIASFTPLCLNVTPQLCQLLMWFCPRLVGYITAVTLVTEESSWTQKSTLTEKYLANPIGVVSADSLEALKVGVAAPYHTGQFAEEDMTIFRYVNLSGYQYLAFSVLQSENGLLDLPIADQQQQQPPDSDSFYGSEPSAMPHLAGIIRILPTKAPRSLDSLATELSESSRRFESKQLKIFLAPEPPGSEIERLSQMFPYLPKDYIIRNLLVTRDEQKTLETLRCITRAAETGNDESNISRVPPIDPSPPFLGPFPKSMEVTAVNLSKISSVGLPPPLHHIKSYHLYSEETEVGNKPQDFSEENRESSFNSTESEKEEAFKVNTHRQTNFSKHPKSLCETLSKVAVASNCAKSHADGHIISQVIGSVLSPHPSYKLLLLTTTIRMQNRSGMPLQVAFLNRDHQAILLTNIRSRCAPLSLLESQSATHAEAGQSHSKIQPISQCHSSYPHLSVLPSMLMETLDTMALGYSIIIPDKEFLSVPQSAFIGNSRVLVTFRPAALAEKENMNQYSTDMPTPPEIRSSRGWTNLIDTQIEIGAAHEKSFVRACKYRAGLSTSHADQGSTFGHGSERKHEELYFSVFRFEKVSALPSEQPVVNLSVFPSMTLINACSTPIDAQLVPETRTQPIQSMPRARPSPSFFTNYTPAADVRQLEPLVVTILPCLYGAFLNPVVDRIIVRLFIPYRLLATIEWFTIFHVYNTPPIIIGASLTMRLKFTLAHRSQWSHSVKFIYPIAKDENITRLQVPCAGLAQVELEILKDTNDFVDFLPAIQRGQQACVISSPRWFIDRSGLDLQPARSGKDKNKLFPTFDSISMLGDSQEPALDLVMLGQGPSAGRKRFLSREIPRCTIEIPPAGSFSDAKCLIEGFVYTLCVQSEQIAPVQTGGAISRCIVVMPKFLVTNRVPDVTLFIRQHKTHGETFSIQPGCTIPLYWHADRDPLLFEFKPGDACGFSWSGPVYPCEQFAGGNHIAVQNGMTGQPKVFDIEISSQRGVICCVIQPLLDDLTESSMSVLLTNKLQQHDVIIKTFHPDVNEEGHPIHEDLKNTKHIHSSQELDIVFAAGPQGVTTIAWPWPFTHKLNLCEISVLSQQTGVQASTLRLVVNTRSRLRSFFEFPRHPTNAMPNFGVFMETKGNILHLYVLGQAVRRSLGQQLLSGITLPKMAPTPSTTPLSENGTAAKSVVKYNSQIDIRLSQVGVSLVSDRRREELLFAEFTQCHLTFMQRDDNQLFKLNLADIQIDSQLEESDKPVLLASRGITELLPVVDSESSSWVVSRNNLPKSKSYAFGSSLTNGKPMTTGPNFSGLPKTSMSTVDLRDEIKKGHPYFLNVWIEREAVSSCDLHLKRVQISLDDLEVDIDVETLNGLNSFVKECLETFGHSRSSGVSRGTIIEWTTTPVHHNFVPFPKNQVIVLEQMFIDKFTAVLWCSFLLDKMPFLSDLLKMGLRILMVSQKLELKGAPLHFEPEYVKSTTRGSIRTLLTTLKGRYVEQILSSIAYVLGYSSLANIPRAPLDIFKGTVGFGLTVADNLSTGLGTILSNLTFDSEYINQRQKERAANARGTRGLREGFTSATKDLKEGLISFGDVFTKPIGGAQKEGFSGLMKGLAKGAVGTIIKPVDKLGQAVSSMSSGIRAEYVTKPLGGYKCRTTRRRKPRMLWGDTGKIRAYDSSEAELRECLGLQMARNVIHSITVSVREAAPSPQHLALLIYPTRLCFTDLYGGKERIPQNEEDVHSTPPHHNSESTAKSVGRAKTRWVVDLMDIVHVRASTHGVAIHTAEGVVKIPTKKATLIKQLYQEISASQHRVKACLQIGKMNEWLKHNNEESNEYQLFL